MSKRRRGRGVEAVLEAAGVVDAAVEVQNDIKNGLADALGVGIGGGINPMGFPQNQGSPWSEQVSQSTTIFKNLRWYLVSNFRQMLSEAYVELGLVQIICDVPVDDALRGGVEIKSQQLDEEQIADLQVSLDRDDDINTVGQAAKWNRLFGGAGIMILTDQDPETPLEIDKIDPDEKLEFRAVDMWELFWDVQNTEGYDPAIQSENFTYYNYYGEQVHKSRVMRLKGITAPSFIRPRLRGWGFSVVETLVRSINQYLKATDLGFEVLDEFKLDIFKIKNLTASLMSPAGEQAIKRRVAIANYQKNYQNAITMDSEDDYDHKQLSFAGLAEAMTGIRMQVASDMRMPITKLFGISSTGFNSGEDDIEVYNAMVESQVRNKIKYAVMRVCEIKCQKLFGFVPDDLSVSFKPLRVLNAEQEESVKTAKFQRLQAMKGTGDLTPQEFRDAVNKGNLVDITLDAVDDLDGFMADTIMESFHGPEDTTDVDDPGADRADTEKSRANVDRGAAGKEPPAPKSADAPKVKAKARNEMGAEQPIKTTTKIATSKSKSRDAPPNPGTPRNPPDESGTESLVVMPKPYTTTQKVIRSVVNSSAFDRASYAADEGDNWIDFRRKELFDRDKAKDKTLWDAATKASLDALGEERWQFTTWWYRKQGGKF